MTKRETYAKPLTADECEAAGLDPTGRDGGPWGQGYPEPMFDGEFDVLNWRVVGERHLKLELGCHGTRLNAIEFGGWTGERPPGRMRIAFRLEPDDYRGDDAVQLVVSHREPC